MTQTERATTTIRERLGWDVTPELYAKIRRLWIAHSKAEDGRDLAGLIATLSQDCVYEIIPTGERWEGHAGARSFYVSFLSAFPDVRFDLKDIVIHFPWDLRTDRFAGERIYYDSGALTRQLADVKE